MDNNLRNTIILKNLPSNLIEEAFVVLKKNQKIKKVQYVDNKNEKTDFDRQSGEEFIVKEAELLVSNYIDKMEKQDLCGNKVKMEFERKYKNMRIFASILASFLMCCFWYIFKM